MNKGKDRQINTESPLYKAVNDITSTIEKYVDRIDLIDIIEIVDNLRVLVEIAESPKIESKIA